MKARADAAAPIERDIRGPGAAAPPRREHRLPYVFAFLWALPSGFIWFFNAEALVAIQVSSYGAVPWIIAACVVAGQFVGYILLYLFSHRVLARSQRVRRAVSKLRVGPPGWRTYGLFATGGLCGLPPLMALFAVYGTMRVGSLGGYLMAAVPTRFVWYMGWAYAPRAFEAGFGWLRTA